MRGNGSLKKVNETKQSAEKDGDVPSGGWMQFLAVKTESKQQSVENYCGEHHLDTTVSN